MKPIRIVCATRASSTDFYTQTALGKSLVANQKQNPAEILLFAENKASLSRVYNSAIERAKDNPAVLVFVHDDILLIDFFWAQSLRQGLEKFDVLGIVGNMRRVPRQASWAFPYEDWQWDQREFLSGVVGQGHGFPCLIQTFSPPGQACKLLDGMLLAADSERLLEAGVSFDSRFDFHFYDLDFCRQAELGGLTMGTWPLSVVHESAGALWTPSWWDGYRTYLQKYAE